MNVLFSKYVLSMTMVIGGMAILSACAPQPTEQADVNVEVSQQELPKMEKFDDALQERIDSGQGVGLAVAIIDGSSENHLTIGHTKAGTSDNISKESIFEIGSITKTFTTLVLADMAIKGEVSLDDPVSKYLPKTVNMPTYEGEEITLKHLATHTSSLPRMPANFNPADVKNPYVDYTPDLMYAFLSDYKLKRPIGEKVDYSNLGMGLLGHILERHSEQSFEELVTERILTPLGMQNTFVIVPENRNDVFTTGHDVAGLPTSHWDLGTLSGAGALRSDITDMTIYLKANMGLIETPLSDAMEMSHKFQQKDEAMGGYVGLGWFTNTAQKNPLTWHNGGTGGYRSFMGFDKNAKTGVVVLVNSQDDADLIAHAVFKHEPDMLKPDQENTGLKFSEDELERLVGDYQLAPNFVISITRKDTKLFAQATGQSKFPIYAKSKTEFFFKVVEASLIFNEDDNGEIASLILDQNGMRQPTVKQ